MEDTRKAFLPKHTAQWRKVLFYIAPVLGLYIAFFTRLEVDNPKVSATLGVAVWMALWWVSEVVPLAITSLLPVVLFPLLGIMNGKAVSSTYFNHVIFLFIGGFLVALAIQKWNLHKRIALRILLWTGVHPGRILFGFMFSTAFLSMWISNTATTMMMVPILLSIIVKLEDLNGREKMAHFAVGLLLATAYSASVGGIATLVGTPPNLAFSQIYVDTFPSAPEISFAQWFLFAFPISVVLFVILYVYLYVVFIRKSGGWKQIDKVVLVEEHKDMGAVSYEEKVVGFVFVMLALLWFFRSDITIGAIHLKGWAYLFPHPKYLNDGTVAVLMAIVLFVIPSKKNKGEYLMDWKAAEDIPWEIILLFGGGFALASGFKTSGLSNWFGEQLMWFKGVHPLLIIFIISILITFLTELTSNTATVQTFLPILAGLAVSVKAHPLLFMLPATIAGSMAFMLPVATPPNAIVFGTRRLRITHMARTGFILNIVGAIVLSLFVYYYGTYLFGMDLGALPDWIESMK